jgi:formylglycine-generating enzyme required for sulfatase activity
MITNAIIFLYTLTGLYSVTSSSDSQKIGQSFVERIPNTLIEFKMVWVPEGILKMSDEEIKVKGFWMGETEVTWDLYDLWAFRLDLSEEEQERGVDAESRPTKPYGAPDKGFGHSGYPAIGMTYFSAEEFCRWLSKKTGKRYRLPTEIEWEYAGRGVEKGDFKLDECAWFWDNALDKTHPVKKKKPNGFGLYDMLGNVMEWCKGVDGKPVACGGSFIDKEEDVHYSARKRQTPDWNRTDPQLPKSIWWLSDAPFVGFRVVCDP